jgi:thioesterase domain-containing protein
LRGRLTEYAYRWQLIRQDFRRVSSGKRSLGEFIGNRALIQSLKRLFGRVAPAPTVVANRDDRAPEMYDQWLLHYLEKLSKTYEPKSYDGKVTLFRSSEEPRGMFIDYAMGWKSFARGGVEIVVVEGDHFTVFNEPGVGRMAEAIAERVGAQ